MKALKKSQTWLMLMESIVIGAIRVVARIGRGSVLAKSLLYQRYSLVIAVSLTLIAFGIAPKLALADHRPNIVWIVVDDMSSHFGYQGEPLVHTPNVDRLARQGTVFTQAYATAPVCSTFRSSMITGMYQTTIGAHHHRSGRGELKIRLPEPIVTVPELFKRAGYFTCISNAAGDRMGKQDYNFEYEPDRLYDAIDYSGRRSGQPFFAQYHLRGGKLRNVPASYEETKAGLDHRLVDPDSVRLPPYYPDHPVLRQDWAAYLDSVNYTDVEVGRIIDRLREDDVLDDTVIFFLTDHGISHARGKQFLYEEGILIPFVVWGPGVIPEGHERHDLIAHIDLAAASLGLAGIEVPVWMQGRPLFSRYHQSRSHVVSARDRCDETVDRIRSIRKGRFKYIRNYYPQRPYLQPNRYKDHKPFMPVLRQLYAEGKLNEVQSLPLAEIRPEEELYDLQTDRWEIHNLADDPAYQDELSRFRALLGRWEMGSNDRGRHREPLRMYNSDMQVYLERSRRRSVADAEELQGNIETMLRWRMEGK